VLRLRIGGAIPLLPIYLDGVHRDSFPFSTFMQSDSCASAASFVLHLNIVQLTVPSETLIIVRIVNVLCVVCCVLSVCLFVHKCTTGEVVCAENT
jgi:hypothetical protein